MFVRQEITLGIGVSVALQLFVSVLAIALLTRMGPAIRHILDENVYSAEAVEDMLATLARTSTPSDVPPPFAAALERAQRNVTEESERPLLRTIEEHDEAAFAGDPQARDTLVAALRDLGKVNRHSMTVEDDQAQWLAAAGAWATVILGAFGFGFGILAQRRLRERLELPLRNLRDVTAQARVGNLQARSRPGPAPHEIEQVSRNIDWLLDHLMMHQRWEGGASTSDADLRRLVVHLLDAAPSPAVVLDATAHRVAASLDALDLDPHDDDDDAEWNSTTVPETSLVLWRRAPTAE